jgi:hypothetical protein
VISEAEMAQVLDRFGAGLATAVKGWKGAAPSVKGQAPVRTRVQ